MADASSRIATQFSRNLDSVFWFYKNAAVHESPITDAEILKVLLDKIGELAVSSALSEQPNGKDSPDANDFGK